MCVRVALHLVPPVLYKGQSDPHLLELSGRKLSWPSTVEHLCYSMAVILPVLLHLVLQGPKRLPKTFLKLMDRNFETLNVRNPLVLEKREKETLPNRLVLLRNTVVVLAITRPALPKLPQNRDNNTVRLKATSLRP